MDLTEAKKLAGFKKERLLVCWPPVAGNPDLVKGIGIEERIEELRRTEC